MTREELAIHHQAIVFQKLEELVGAFVDMATAISGDRELVEVAICDTGVTRAITINGAPFVQLGFNVSDPPQGHGGVVH